MSTAPVIGKHSFLKPPTEMTGNASPFDGFADAAGRILAQARREWQAERELAKAETRQTIAELRAEVAGLKLTLHEIAAERVATLHDGKDGEPGPKGDPGDSIVGPAGPSGAKGEPGESIVGPAGPRGEKGDPGESIVGPAGPTGERGDTGESIAGPAGEKGDPGESIAGPQGEPGKDGAAGQDGAAGRDGIDGKDGAPGRDGIDGAPGRDGIDGRAGIDGKDGRDGSDGKDGQDGIGERGPEGPAGKFSALKEWARGVHYESDLVTHNGSSYCALRDTAEEPPCADWHLVAARGIDAPVGTVHARYTEGAAYKRFDLVAFNGGEWRAKRDDPGPLPGDGWALSAKQGKPGQRGEKGDRGERGPSGPAGPKIVEWVISGYQAVPVLSDGSAGPALNVREILELYHAEVAR